MRRSPRLLRPLVIATALLTVLVGCEAEEPKPPEPPPPAEPEAVVEPTLALTATPFAELPGWQEDDLAGAALAFSRSCRRLLALSADASVGTPALETTAGDWHDACNALLALGDAAADPAGPDAIDTAALKSFFETYFEPFSARDLAKDEGEGANADQGLFTGYFEAELHGSRSRSDDFPVPLYARPKDLITVDLGKFDPDLRGKGVVGLVVDGRLVPYPTRGEIEAGALADQGLELLWIDDAVDVFLLQVQGSGRVVLPDGEVVRIGFAAHNGHGYRSIGRKLIDAGELEAHQASWNGIRGWVEDHPDKAAELFAFNPRFIFFRVLDGDGPLGAEGVALTPERSLAVDTRFIPLGMPLWLDTVRPGGDDTPMRRLMVAQDKGGAIKGVVRGDFFWGYGDAALAEAGRMKSTGRYFLLLPKPLADRVKASS